MNVLIIPEDFRKDQYVLKPIIEKVLAHMGLRARVRVYTDPKLGGVGEALKWERVWEIVDRYRSMVRIFLLIVDRDCDESRRTKLDVLEESAEAMLARRTDRCFLAENAWQELEVWALVGMSDLLEAWSWEEIRRDCNPKKNYYVSYVRKQGRRKDPHQGRESLAKQAAASYRRIR